MEKRALLAVVLSIAVFYVFSTYIMPPPPKQPATAVQQKATSSSLTSKAVTTDPTAASSSVPVSAAATQAGLQAREIKVDTDLYRAVFSSKGASLKRLTLKKYRENAGAGGREITLIGEESPDNYSLITDARGIAIDPAAVYSVNTDDVTVSRGDKKELAFSWISPQGIMVRKSFIIQGDSYGIQMNLQIQNGSAARQEGSIQLLLNNPATPRNNDTRFEQMGAVTFADNGLRIDSVKDLEKGQKQYDKGILWTGFDDKYFLGAVLSVNSDITNVAIKKSPAGREVSTITFAPVSLNPGQMANREAKLYFGPKDLDILKVQGNELERAIDLGWFSALAKPMLHILKFLYRFVHNYGIAIIIVTVVLKVLFFPLTYKSYKSMKDMQKLQPKMAELKEKYKNDRDAMNKAIMELYKTHKVNPMGGCLPMVVQIPVFFALYKALMFSIELRHAPFMFWIQDLSAKDPYYVTPLIMGATMFIQQKMTPTAGMDPTQAKMMLMLPVVFTFMFLNFPSGLVLYWLVNNILTIGQQYYINKQLK
jgi:YidC/Oxa1 family membrane protein insertase